MSHDNFGCTLLMAENLAVVHARYIRLEAHWDRVAAARVAKADDSPSGERSN